MEILFSKEGWRALLEMKHRGMNVTGVLEELRQELMNIPPEKFRPTRSGLFAIRIRGMLFRIREREKGRRYEVILVSLF